MKHKPDVKGVIDWDMKAMQSQKCLPCWKIACRHR
jgi:hypothetical protein